MLWLHSADALHIFFSFLIFLSHFPSKSVPAIIPSWKQTWVNRMCRILSVRVPTFFENLTKSEAFEIFSSTPRLHVTAIEPPRSKRCGNKAMRLIQECVRSYYCHSRPNCHYFYSASALLAMQSAVLATVRPSVRLSFRHVPVLCPDEWSYLHSSGQ